jgi:glycine dehydrogenase subunit 1
MGVLVWGSFSTRKEYIRKIPGRIVGKTTDDQQRTAYVMTLRAREQDIRREKASSNICTNHALCALQATIYLSALGEVGLKKLAQRNLQS